MVHIFVKLELFCLITGSFVLIFLSNRYRKIIRHNESDDKNSPDFNKYKHILTWTPDSGNVKLKGWSYPELDGFKKAGCPEYRCYLTNNRSYLGNNPPKNSKIYNTFIDQVAPLLTLTSSMRFYSIRGTSLCLSYLSFVWPGSIIFTGMWRLLSGSGWTGLTSGTSGVSLTGPWATD